MPVVMLLLRRKSLGPSRNKWADMQNSRKDQSLGRKGLHINFSFQCCSFLLARILRRKRMLINYQCQNIVLKVKMP